MSIKKTTGEAVCFCSDAQRLNGLETAATTFHLQGSYKNKQSAFDGLVPAQKGLIESLTCLVPQTVTSSIKQ